MQRNCLLTAGTLALLLGFAPHAHAQVVVYNNTTTFVGSGTITGGANSSTSGTYLDADDINTLAGTGGLGITKFKFSVANFNTTNTSANPNVRFFAADGTGGLPGTYLGGLNFNAISFTAGSVGVYTYTAPTGTTVFTIPTNGSFFAGITFTGATATKLNNLGQGLYNPPSVGSSADKYFSSDNPGLFTTSNPAGAFYTITNQVANFGWEFEVAAAPEPSQFAALAVGAMGLGALRLRARRRPAA